MIIYSRWNCKHQCQELPTTPTKTWTREEHRKRKYEAKMAKFRFKDIWLENRLTLFNHFTYPSILSQTDQDFRWIGIVHKDSPAWFIEKLTFFDRMEIQLVEIDAEATVKEDPTSINLDTDDAISRNFIEDAKKITFDGETIFSHGLKYRVWSDFWMDTRDEQSHFNMIQHSDITVLDYLHGRAKLPKNILYSPEPMWIEVIHEKNIANKLRPPYSKKHGGPPNMGLKHAMKYFEFDKTNLTREHLIGNFTTKYV